MNDNPNLDSYISEDLPQAHFPKLYIDKNILLLASSLGILKGLELNNNVCNCPAGHTEVNQYCPINRWGESIALGGLYANEVLVELIELELKANAVELISPDERMYKKAFTVEAKMHYETSQKYTDLLEALARILPFLYLISSSKIADLISSLNCQSDVYNLIKLIEESGVINEKQ